MTDLSAIYREDATHEEVVEAYQALIDSGEAWRMDGSTGRAAEALIEAGDCVLGETRTRTAYGATIPSRHDVVPGTPGSPEYAARVREENECN